MKKITLIVPVYQVEAYLAECLDSIVNQDFKDFICILVNDGSKDGSAKIMEQYRERYPDLFRIINQENRGLSGARNTGIDITDTEYIAFLDSDDVALPNFLSSLYEVATRENADIVESGYIRFYEDGRAEQIIRPDIKGKTVVRENPFVLCKFTAVAWNKLYKTSLFTESGVRYPLGLIYEDCGTTPLLLARSRTVYSIDEPLIRYRQRQGSITAQLNKKILHLYDLADIIRQDEGLAAYPDYRDALVILRMESLIMKLSFVTGQRDEVKKAYRYLKDWNPKWRRNVVWRRLTSTSAKSVLFRTIFSMENPYLLEKIMQRKKRR